MTDRERSRAEGRDPSEGEHSAAAGEVTRILQAAGASGAATEELLPLVYDELRRIASSRLAKVPPGNTLQPTALVHEVYMRLVASGPETGWQSRGHFFVAAGEAMRRILVEQARAKGRLKRGGDRQRVELEEPPIEPPSEDVLAVHEALEKLEAVEPEKAKLVKLRYFAGLDRQSAAEALGMPLRTSDRHWRFVVAWLYRAIQGTAAS